ncbi:unnamed protein product [Periconia digitata]|uniref:SprT-like domain-containing protein n=1 Tax=Periconia digitata TaxID=1303443 RepID=A0A9W4XRK6_9PLEO|nr:unnamed protein product [Periconia digitata]
MNYPPSNYLSSLDRTSVGSYLENRLIPYDSEPDLYYRQPSGHVPRPLSSLDLRNPQLKCTRNLGWNISWAVAFVVDRLGAGELPDATEALKKIRLKAARLEREGDINDIPFHLFHKLDQTLFAGHLKKAVYVDIQDLGHEVSGATFSQGCSPDPEIRRVSIILNHRLLKDVGSQDIIATLIHHMIHAYFLIACGPEQEKEVHYGRLGHGLAFAKIMTTIKKISAAEGRPLQSLDFGHPFERLQYFGPRPPRRFSRSQTADEKWYRSYCCSDVISLASSQIEEWYGEVCQPLFDLPKFLRKSRVPVFNIRTRVLEEMLRAETKPSSDSCEFIFNEESSVLVPQNFIDNYYSVARAFKKSGIRYMKIHKDVPWETFERFLQLLHTDTYDPDPKHIVRTGDRGPPIIKPSNGSQPYLLADIHMGKMGDKMSFKDLKTVALERMYRHSITSEDPVDLLAAIYDGTAEPDKDVKMWVRKFLVRGSNPTPTIQAALDTDEWVDVGASPPSTSSPYEPSNLAKLEADMLGYKHRFGELLAGSAALKYEVARARQDLQISSNLAGIGFLNGTGAGQHQKAAAVTAMMLAAANPNNAATAMLPWHQQPQQNALSLARGQPPVRISVNNNNQRGLPWHMSSSSSLSSPSPAVANAVAAQAAVANAAGFGVGLGLGASAGDPYGNGLGDSGISDSGGSGWDW